MGIGSFARDMKDSALALSLKKFLNERFQDYGEVLECDIDSKKNRLVIRAQMRGETAPITAAIERYSIEDGDEGKVFVAHSFSSSRDWITRLLTRLFAGKRYKLPATVSILL
jgi:hypothetical protein